MVPGWSRDTTVGDPCPWRAGGTGGSHGAGGLGWGRAGRALILPGCIGNVTPSFAHCPISQPPHHPKGARIGIRRYSTTLQGSYRSKALDGPKLVETGPEFSPKSADFRPNATPPPQAMWGGGRAAPRGRPNQIGGRRRRKAAAGLAPGALAKSPAQAYITWQQRSHKGAYPRRQASVRPTRVASGPHSCHGLHQAIEEGRSRRGTRRVGPTSAPAGNGTNDDSETTDPRPSTPQPATRGLGGSASEASVAPSGMRGPKWRLGDMRVYMHEQSKGSKTRVKMSMRTDRVHTHEHLITSTQAEAAQVWSSSARFRVKLGELDPISAKKRPTHGRVWPRSIEFRPISVALAVSSRQWAMICQARVEFGHIRSGIGAALLSNQADIGQTSAMVAPNWTNHPTEDMPPRKFASASRGARG